MRATERDEFVSNPLYRDFWSTTTGQVGRRTIAALVAAAAVFAAPAVARAGDIAPSVLGQAAADPNSSLPVIVQTRSAPSNAAAVEVNAVTTKSRNAAKDALNRVNDESRRAQSLRQLLAGRLAFLNTAQQNAAALAARAAKSRKKADVTAAQKAAADAAKAAADAKAAQASSDAEQATLLSTQLAASQAQAANQLDLAQSAAAIHWQYSLLPAVSTRVDADDIAVLQSSKDIVAVSPDAMVAPTGDWNPQKWVVSMGARGFWYSQARRSAAGQTPTIAIVDSGVDGTKARDFGGRFLGQVNLTSIAPNSAGDGRGHGTMVASIAAGGNDYRTGSDPDAPILSLDVMNDNGEGRTSDLIAACDWILQHKDQYNIKRRELLAPGRDRLHVPVRSPARRPSSSSGSTASSWSRHPATTPSTARRAVFTTLPASDPFVITVGGVDINDTASVNNDVAAPWSAWGYTNDGFLKPDIVAPGRYIIGAIPLNSTLAATGGQVPSLVPTGYLQLSGTSFAAPMVAAAAAAILAVHPNYTPGQVKGVLMLTANELPAAVPGSVGVGELDMRAATSFTGSPPDPDAGLEPFITSSADGPMFDAASWSSAVQSNASWNSASWSSASWSSASWSSASWSSASWSSASWSSAAWSSASWSSAAWSSASWNSSTSANGLAVNPQDASPGSAAEDDSTQAGGDTSCGTSGSDGTSAGGSSGQAGSPGCTTGDASGSGNDGSSGGADPGSGDPGTG